MFSSALYSLSLSCSGLVFWKHVKCTSGCQRWVISPGPQNTLGLEWREIPGCSPVLLWTKLPFTSLGSQPGEGWTLKSTPGVVKVPKELVCGCSGFPWALDRIPNAVKALQFCISCNTSFQSKPKRKSQTRRQASGCLAKAHLATATAPSVLQSATHGSWQLQPARELRFLSSGYRVPWFWKNISPWFIYIKNI